MCRPTKRSRPGVAPTLDAPVKKSFFDPKLEFPAALMVPEPIEEVVSASSPSSSEPESEIERPKTFVFTMYDMVNDEKNAAAIGFAPNGSEIQVRDTALLSEEILPKYFRHKNVTSFYRQLNSYGFRTIRSAPEVAHTFVHDIFSRDRPDLLATIVRKKSAGATAASTSVSKQEKALKKVTGASEVLKMIEELKVLQTIQEQQVRELEERNRKLTNEIQVCCNEEATAYKDMKDLLETQTMTISKLFGEEASKAFAAQAQPEVAEFFASEPVAKKLEEEQSVTFELPGDAELELPDQDLLELETLLCFDDIMV